jgi:hypothetical protein
MRSEAASVKIAEPAPATEAGVPWYIWCGVLAVTSSSIGGAWDVSWHRSIGRDTFWTPAHMAIYACGVLAGILCGHLMITTTFGHLEDLKSSSICVLGLRAPLGVFLAAWGGIAMLSSAPFDNWWHAAYGLDVKILSPPHVLLMLGVFMVSLGVLFLILSAMNQAGAESRRNHQLLKLLFLYIGGLIISQQMFLQLENTWQPKLHSASAYIAVAFAIPLVLAILSEAAQFRWTATTVTGVYTLFRIGEILILPLFPAQPKLGPVSFSISHMVPANFPILILFPAIALDLLWQRTERWELWKRALISGAMFLAVLVAVEWPFATFLLSKASENRFFGTMYFSYTSVAASTERRRIFSQPSHGLVLFDGLLRAAIYSSIGIGIGLRFGRWMRSVQR